MRKAAAMAILLICAGFTGMDWHTLDFPKGWPQPVYNFKNNPLSQATIKLGQSLFYDPILSADNKISCASCHSQFNAFAHTDHALSHGINDKIGNRNAPALINLAWQDEFMWDGAVNHLDMQALAPLSNPDEMGSSIQEALLKINQSDRYRSLTFEAFGDSALTGDRFLKSLSQFMLTLVSDQSTYDAVREGRKKFTPQEANGYRLFREHCNSCHAEPLFRTNKFENNGLPVDSSLHDAGRMTVTRNPKDSLRFKIPTLRNIEFTPPYMHDGRFKKLSEVLNHYTNGIQHGPTLSENLKKPIHLTSNEKVDLIAFLLTLSDKQFLFNPKYGFPQTEQISKQSD